MHLRLVRVVHVHVHACACDLRPSPPICAHLPQASFLGFCDALEAADCGLEACSRPPHTIVYELRCFLRAFAESYRGAAQLPQGAAFTSALRTWLTAGPGSEYQSDVGFVDGQVKFARIEFKSRPLLIYHTHLASSNTKKLTDHTRKQVFETIAKHAGRCPMKHGAILGGDFNCDMLRF